VDGCRLGAQRDGQGARRGRWWGRRGRRHGAGRRRGGGGRRGARQRRRLDQLLRLPTKVQSVGALKKTTHPGKVSGDTSIQQKVGGTHKRQISKQKTPYPPVSISTNNHK